MTAMCARCLKQRHFDTTDYQEFLIKMTEVGWITTGQWSLCHECNKKDKDEASASTK